VFLNNLIKKVKTVVDTTEEIDNHFFAKVMEEIESGFKDKDIIGKAYELAEDNSTKRLMHCRQREEKDRRRDT